MPDEATKTPAGRPPFLEQFPLTVDDVARQLSCDPETVRRYVRAGAISAARHGRSSRAPLRFTQDDVDSYLQRRRVG